MKQNYSQKVGSLNGTIFIITSIILFLGAIGIFIWLISEATEEQMTRNILYGSAFLACTVGLLVYVLFVSKAPKTSAAILWIAMVLGAGAFATGVFIKTDGGTSITMTRASSTGLSSELI